MVEISNCNGLEYSNAVLACGNSFLRRAIILLILAFIYSQTISFTNQIPAPSELATRFLPLTSF